MMSAFLEKEIQLEISRLEDLAVSTETFNAVQTRTFGLLSALCEQTNRSNLPSSFSIGQLGAEPIFHCDYGRAGRPASQAEILASTRLHPIGTFQDLVDAQVDAGLSFAEYSFDQLFTEYDDSVFLILSAVVAPETNLPNPAPSKLDIVYTVTDLNREYSNVLEQLYGIDEVRFTTESNSALSTLKITGPRVGANHIYAAWRPGNNFRKQFEAAFPFVFVVSLILITIVILGLLKLRSLTAAISQQETEMRTLASHDGMTGLANRRHFNERVSAMMQEADPQTYYFGFLDLDHFKQVNDTYGHDVGDALIIEAAKRLKSTLGYAGIIARLGGDEFAFFISPKKVQSDISELMSNVVTKISAPFSHNNIELHPSASLGLAQFPRDGETFDQIAKSADIALYDAKASGRGRYSFFSVDSIRSSN
ncbi:GGDEF domain-containing protein [Henriciella barbarensis]|uniref:GGDEF domain-containing protein n=2 Tax=Henriciella barbarensis TaxID=86342 RepID=A0A399R2N3_9PROT|nr:GGDEF domain-containing protein [Henriciella barbarensis]